MQLVYSDASEEVRVLLEAVEFESFVSDMRIMKEIVLQSTEGTVQEDVYKGLKSICVLKPDLSRRDIEVQREVHILFYYVNVYTHCVELRVEETTDNNINFHVI